MVSPFIQEVANRDRLIVRELEPACFGIGIPIRGGHSVLAVAALFRRDPMEMSPQEMQMVDSLGPLLGVSLENSRLWAELQNREADRTEWISRIISAQEDERRHIAHELHDDSVQTLVLLYRRLDQVEDSVKPLPEPVRTGLQQARRQVEELIGSLRNFAHDLRPPALDDLGVASCIHRLLLDLSLRTGIEWEMNVEGTDRRFGRDAEVGLFRIAQEAIRNVGRHAQARSVHVDLRFESQGVYLRVVDDGQGMSPRVWQGGSAASDRLGLLGMQERASLLGGELLIDSRPGGGTKISVTVPFSPQSSRSTEARLKLPVGQ